METRECPRGDECRRCEQLRLETRDNERRLKRTRNGPLQTETIWQVSCFSKDMGLNHWELWDTSHLVGLEVGDSMGLGGVRLAYRIGRQYTEWSMPIGKEYTGWSMSYLALSLNFLATSICTALIYRLRDWFTWSTASFFEQDGQYVYARCGMCSLNARFIAVNPPRLIQHTQVDHNYWAFFVDIPPPPSPSET